MRQALTVYTREAYPDDWASTYGNLGTVYWRLGQRENGTALLERAVAAFRSALEVHVVEEAAAGMGGDAEQSRHRAVRTRRARHHSGRCSARRSRRIVPH